MDIVNVQAIDNILWVNDCTCCSFWQLSAKYYNSFERKYALCVLWQNVTSHNILRNSINLICKDNLDFDWTANWDVWGFKVLGKNCNCCPLCPPCLVSSVLEKKSCMMSICAWGSVSQKKKQSKNLILYLKVAPIGILEAGQLQMTVKKIGRKLNTLAKVSQEAEVTPSLGSGQKTMKHATRELKVKLRQLYFSPGLFVSYSVSINGQ